MTVSSSKHTAAALPENTGSLHGFSGGFRGSGWLFMDEENTIIGYA
ncbi:MAG TPA: hypothetical protein O0X42_03950 [Methanocorpusculum sp.]|nr:hypothetical protein [Methanocorpusculum sp.]